MINIANRENCCGCSACESVCPHDAIAMNPDALGFKYPIVDKDKCVNCGLCDKVCSFNDTYDTSSNYAYPLLFGARHKDIKEIETSRSGAAFIALSDHILELGGIVYGVGYEGHFHVVHKRAISKEERNEFKGSKYVQSDLKDTFRQVKQDLKDGLLVMFSGTPCQIAGLKSFVGNKLSKHLFLIDIICHGVPSPNIWKDYLHFIEMQYGGEASHVDFRDKKTFGWHSHKELFVIQGKRINTDWFKKTFYKHIMLRPSCSNCHFCNTRRPGDITLADFWGWEKTDPSINADDKGISLLFINTDKGKKLFDDVEYMLAIVPARIENCIQHNMVCPSVFHYRWQKFEKDYAKKKFSYVYTHIDDYDKPPFAQMAVSKLKRVVKGIIGR